MPSATTKITTHPFQTDDPRLRPIHEKVLAEQALVAEDVTALYLSKDILAIGWLANYVRERRHGQATLCAVDSLVVSRAATAAACGLCGRASAPVDIAAQVEQVGTEVDEFIVLNRDAEVAPLLGAVELLKTNWPHVRIAALTVEEIAGHTGSATWSAEKLCRSLREAGADALIGSGAEVFFPALRHRLWRHAGTAENRGEARRAALGAGLGVADYVVQRNGTPQQQADELLSFREHAAENFAALSFDPDATTTLSLPVTTGMQEMKQISIARLVLDDVAHIRAYGQMLGGKLLQIALRFGASWLDGTSLANAPRAEVEHELAREIQVAGREAKAVPSRKKAILIA